MRVSSVCKCSTVGMRLETTVKHGLMQAALEKMGNPVAAENLTVFNKSADGGK